MTRTLAATSLRYNDTGLELLDQRQLPHEEVWLHCDTPGQLIAHIHSLAVRGAPLIGLAAALMVAHRALRGIGRVQLLEELEALRASRPTAVNLMNYLDRLRKLIEAGEPAEVIETRAAQLFEEDRELCQRMAEHGLPLVPQGGRILTHCNTGSLATAGIGTALGVITEAHRRGKEISVWVGETRPLLQGGRLTAWELDKAGANYQIISDSMAGGLMALGKVDLVLVGADRIARNGDVANKVGTYSLAVLAHAHQIPFYVVAPQTTIDLNCVNGHDILIEQRRAEEIRGVETHAGSLTWSPADAPVYNPAFDLTPAQWITGWVLDNGLFTDFEDYVSRHTL